MDLNKTVWCFEPRRSDQKDHVAEDFFPRFDLCASASIFIRDLQLTTVNRSATWPQQTFCWTTETVATLTKLNQAVVQAYISWIVYCGKIWWQSISFLTLRAKRHKAVWIEASFHTSPETRRRDILSCVLRQKTSDLCNFFGLESAHSRHSYWVCKYYVTSWTSDDVTCRKVDITKVKRVSFIVWDICPGRQTVDLTQG